MNRSTSTGHTSERGIAFVTALLMLFLSSSLLAAFIVGVQSDSRLRAVDRWRTQSFYAAHAGLEKLTSDLGNMFATDYSPTTAEVTALQNTPPALANVQYIAQDGLGYTIQFPSTGGNPTTQNRTILSGPFQGFMGQVTPYTLTVTAQMVDGAETRLQRTVQTVGIPVFQFGIFSEADLSYFPGPVFNFGGRVHSNRHLFLASGNQVTLGDRVTAVGEVIRQKLSNGWPTSSGYTGTVRLLTSPGTFRNLLPGEGSVVDTIGSALNEPTWTNLSLGNYNGNIRNDRTGARRLDLPLITVGGTNADLIRRPAVGEDPLITPQRLFAQAQIRILLSDNANEITDLQTVSTGTTPLGRLAVLPIPGYVGVPLAVSSGNAGQGYRSPAGTPLHGGFLKVEYRNAASVWTDVTVEWMNLGIARRNFDSAGCAEPHPNAILRFQRVRVGPAVSAPCGVSGGGVPSNNENDYWPLTFYDTREGRPRDNMGTGVLTMTARGVMHYVELDVNNLRRWLAGTIGASGGNVVNENGFAVYFSDRRTNRNTGLQETGDFGDEDFVNAGSVNGDPNGILDTGEDVNGNGMLDVYGRTPRPPTGATAPLNNAATPQTLVTMAEARINRAIFFRRALKIVNGAVGQLPAQGLTIVAENPVYVQGNYNASAAGFLNNNAPAAIMADTITLLSNSWSDTLSFQNPNNPANRPATTTWYRFAVIAGKGISFPQLGGTPQDYGTDGGVHNFLRYLENWGDDTLWYRGSIANFYFNRQGTGVYKCCTNVYSPPTRQYTFDTNFLNPALLPPKTPMFRDVNATGFVQITR